MRDTNIRFKPSVPNNLPMVASVRRNEKKETDRVVRCLTRSSKSDELSDKLRSVVLSMRAEQEPDCGELDLLPMKGDGQCAYRAMMACLGLDYQIDTKAFRRTLYYLLEELTVF